MSFGKSFVCLAAGALMLGIVSTAAPAAVILSNLPGTDGGTGTNLGLGTDSIDRTKAVGLTTGAMAYSFTSLEALIGTNSTGTGGNLTGGIYSDSAGAPGSELVAFNPVAIADNAATSIVTLTAASDFTLLANTSYWFVLDGPATSNNILWASLDPNAAPTPTGVTFLGYQFSSSGGVNWGSSSIYNGVRINVDAHVVPEPASIATLGLAAAGLLMRRRRA